MADPLSSDLYRTMNAGFVQEMYEEYLRDPSSVDPEWRALFENGGKGLEPRAQAGMGSGEPGMGTSPATSAPAAATAHSPIPTADSRSMVPMKGAAARLVANMQASLTVPTATSFRDIAVATLDARRKALNAAQAPKKFSYTHLIAWALVQAAKQFPVMTHAFAEIDGVPNRVTPDGINLGLAVDVEKKDGSHALVVPVIKHAESMDFAAFHAAYEGLVSKARTNALLPDDYKGATMTLTNPGTIGTVASVPRLMAGQGSIIATGAIRDVAGARVMTITSTYDHRIIQGAESGAFLRAVDQMLQGEGGFYRSMGNGESGLGTTPAAVAPAPTDSTAQSPLPIPQSPAGFKAVAAAMALVRAHRGHGLSLAHLDPLGAEPAGDPACDPAHVGLSADDMTRIPADVLRVFTPGTPTMAEVLPALRRVYCGTIAYEFEHIARHEERVWLRQQVEEGSNRALLSREEKTRLLGRLTSVEALERFLHKTYLGQKRFSIEGLDMAVPMLDQIVETAGDNGACDVVIGMAHRGRLNVLAHVVNLPYETIVGEFESHGAGGEMKPEGGTGDVKYHHGAVGAFETPSGRRVTVTLVPNPSHLEAVNPVVEGRTRAEQTTREAEPKHDVEVALPVVLHGDAAFSGQGIVAEAFNLARLKGYATGGTVHIITNNQVGFTTDPGDGRSTEYASDLAKGFDVPIIHVNADDPEACIAAVRLAMTYRETWHNDVVIDLVGYRRWGHNEGDEPSYTQPVMYEKIRAHPTVRQRYAEQLAAEGLLDAAQATALFDRAYKRLADAQAAVKRKLASQGDLHDEPVRALPPEAPEPATAVVADELRRLNEALLAVPDGFQVNAKLRKQLDRRRETIGSAGGIEWAHAEALAFASLVAQGVPIRLTGQDSERGTFSQRHLVLHDAADGRPWAPVQHVPGASASFELHNSPLSEYACVGFEYGYACAAQETLVLWEAQFGDFANGAEIIVDQFIFAGLAKWGLTSRLTLLLPHGYEGQGPEHSSARVERFVALGAERNIRVANCTTPANYFHLLRRQALHEELRPLILMTPKSLLRLPAATSRIEDLSEGAFQAVIDDEDARGTKAAIRRLLLCSGKVYYDLIASPLRKTMTDVAIGRVELLYPLPGAAIAALIRGYPNLKELVWVQEEPFNMGARKFLVPQMRKLVPGLAIGEVARPERASPAEGYPAAHAAEQARIVKTAFEGKV